MAVSIQNPGKDAGTAAAGADRLALFLKVFAGEVLTAFSRSSVAMNNHIVRTITSGKSATFPVMGRAVAKYLAAGDSLDAQRSEIKHTEQVVNIDGLLTADVLIFDLDDAMNHYDVKAEYTKQLGEALAIAADGAIFAEIATMANSDESITGLGKPVVETMKTTTAATVISDLATSGKEILDFLAAARGQFTKNYVPASDRYFYCTPDVYSAVVAALLPTVANYAALLDEQSGMLKPVCGFTIIEVPHLLSGGGDGKHAFPSAAATSGAPVTKAVVAGLFAHRSAVGTVKLKDLNIERARRPELQSDEIIAKYAMGHKGLRPEACGALLFKA